MHRLFKALPLVEEELDYTVLTRPPASQHHGSQESATGETVRSSRSQESVRTFRSLSARPSRRASVKATWTTSEDRRYYPAWDFVTPFRQHSAFEARSMSRRQSHV